MNGAYSQDIFSDSMAPLSSISFRNRLGREFFNQPTLQASQALIGKVITHSYRGKTISGIINETEAYIGPDDRAAHSYLHPEKAPQQWHNKFNDLITRHTGRDPQALFERWASTRAKITPRNLAEYLEGGHIYIYKVYGLHWQLNFSTGGEGVPECVLIRSVIPVSELPGGRYEIKTAEISAANGPGKLCTYLKLDGSFYAEDATRSERVWIEDADVEFPRRALQKGPRIGIDYAGEEWAAKPWRFRVEAGDIRV